ncbi:hypothetical protein COS75_03250 [Candidatus Pacearchaeota archaeon CG06_land_8_20_14_3_00_35_12]|nr:MAG: hypothetical protein COS75_03250 [Candidatus Pacearchaeota archaeon CG06_land_8_20_14_3_00_35_12]
MSEKDLIYEEKVKYAGIFDFKDVYQTAYTWLTDYQYWVEERTYSEKIKPNGKEVEIKWIAKRKISDYFRFFLKVDWHIVGMTTVEMTDESGNKIKMNKGQFEIKVSAYLEKDYENRWEGNAFGKFLRGTYDRFVIRSRIEQYEDKVAGELEEYVAALKSFFAIEGKRVGA